MKKDPLMFLDHILDSINLIEVYTEGIDKETFLENRQIQDSVIRRIEIIGEAVKNLDHDFKERYPDIDWRDIAGMRDVIVHAYFGVDPQIVWKVVEKDLGPLKFRIEEIMNQIQENVD